MQAKRPKYKSIERRQMIWLDIAIDELVDSEHPVRVIWELVGKLDWSGFESAVRSFEGQIGSSRWPPRLLASVWLYAYQQGIASAREIERRMAWEPGPRWLCGAEVINAHTLSDFRLSRQQDLEALLTQLLAVCSQEGLVDFRPVVQDGTKIQASAGQGSAHRRPTLENKLVQARRYLQELDQEAVSGREERRTQRQAARERSGRERLQRLEAALEEMARQEQTGGNQPPPRVSETEPESRRMRHTEHGGVLPSYNVQLSTETTHNFIVGVSVTQDSNDTQQLAPALETIERFTGTKPERLIADAGYTTRDSVAQVAKAEVELIAPMRDEQAREASVRQRLGITEEFSKSRFVAEGDHLRCPAGSELPLETRKKHHGHLVQIFQAEAAVCQACPHKQQCCPRTADGRRIEKVMGSEAVQQHVARMQTEPARQLYRQRSKVAEFPHLRIKAHWKLRRFSVRGLHKAAREALWMVLAFNFSQWMWARKRQAVVA